MVAESKGMPGLAEGKYRLAVVSGASSGIGAATAKALARSGWRVVLVARSADALAGVEEEIRKAGGEAISMPADASDGKAIQELAKTAIRLYGVPDLIVNGAGAGTWRFIEETSPDQARSMMDAPYFAAFNLTQAFMPEMLRRRSGLVVHVNSPASCLSWPGATGYTAARWALRGLHEALSLDLAGTGVRSMHVVFGKVTSDYFRNNPESEKHLPGIAKIVPLLAPEECAEVILRAVARPRREIIHPLMLRVFYWMNLLVPGVVRSLAVRTGRRHDFVTTPAYIRDDASTERNSP
jgi:NADP-dependent 3-hydroxy acid dehydrogenase YdfG